jgi:DNA-binding NarL/FixJ family response regulator
MPIHTSESTAVLVVLSDDPDRLKAAGEIKPTVSVYLSRHSPAFEIGRAVQAAASSGQVRLAGSAAKRGDDRPLAAKMLTGRELEVLELVGRGEPSKAIAVALGIRERTVKFHLSAAMRKLGTRSRTEAVMAAIRTGQMAL